MATNFPATLDSITTQTTSMLATASWANQVSDAVEALETKVGINSSTATSSHDYKISSLESDNTTNKANITTISGLLTTHKTSSDHDSRYYTESEVDTISGTLSGALDTHKTSSDHDSRYYTETEVDSLFTTTSGTLQGNIDDKVSIDGSSTMTAALQNSTTSCLENTALQSFYAFKLKDGLGADNTGIYFNLATSSIDVRYLGTSYLSMSVLGVLTINPARTGTIGQINIYGSGEGKDGSLTYTDNSHFSFTRDLLVSVPGGAAGNLYLEKIDGAGVNASFKSDGGNATINASNSITLDSDTINLAIGATTVTGTSLITLTDGSNADTLHTHSFTEDLAHSDLSDMPDAGGTNSDHDSRYYTETEVDSISGTLSGALTSHKSSSDHDGRYYTETELNNGQLDSRYYTEGEVDAISGTLLALNGSSTMTGIVKTSNAVAVEQESAQSFWAFKYLDAIAANTGFYFDISTTQFQYRYLNTPVFLCDVSGNPAFTGNTFVLNYGRANSTNGFYFRAVSSGGGDDGTLLYNVADKEFGVNRPLLQTGSAPRYYLRSKTEGAYFGCDAAGNADVWAKDSLSLTAPIVNQVIDGYTVSGTRIKALVDGSNADALHSHSELTTNSGTIANAYIRHTLTAGEAGAQTFSENWNTCTVANVVSMNYVSVAASDGVMRTLDPNGSTYLCSLTFNGSAITATLSADFAENDVITIYVVYEVS